MSDKPANKRKLNWKRAFCLLKREALRRFRIKYIDTMRLLRSRTVYETKRTNIEFKGGFFSLSPGRFYTNSSSVMGRGDFKYVKHVSRRSEQSFRIDEKRDRSFNVDKLGELLVKGIIIHLRPRTMRRTWRSQSLLTLGNLNRVNRRSYSEMAKRVRHQVLSIPEQSFLFESKYKMLERFKDLLKCKLSNVGVSGERMRAKTADTGNVCSFNVNQMETKGFAEKINQLDKIHSGKIMSNIALHEVAALNPREQFLALKNSKALTVKPQDVFPSLSKPKDFNDNMKEKDSEALVTETKVAANSVNTRPKEVIQNKNVDTKQNIQKFKNSVKASVPKKAFTKGNDLKMNTNPPSNISDTSGVKKTIEPASKSKTAGVSSDETKVIKNYTMITEEKNNLKTIDDNKNTVKEPLLKTAQTIKVIAEVGQKQPVKKLDDFQKSKTVQKETEDKLDNNKMVDKVKIPQKLKLEAKRRVRSARTMDTTEKVYIRRRASSLNEQEQAKEKKQIRVFVPSNVNQSSKPRPELPKTMNIKDKVKMVKDVIKTEDNVSLPKNSTKKIAFQRQRSNSVQVPAHETPKIYTKPRAVSLVNDCLFKPTQQMLKIREDLLRNLKKAAAEKAKVKKESVDKEGQKSEEKGEKRLPRTKPSVRPRDTVEKEMKRSNSAEMVKSEPKAYFKRRPTSARLPVKRFKDKIAKPEFIKPKRRIKSSDGLRQKKKIPQARISSASVEGRYKRKKSKNSTKKQNVENEYENDVNRSDGMIELDTSSDMVVEEYNSLSLSPSEVLSIAYTESTVKAEEEEEQEAIVENDELRRDIDYGYNLFPDDVDNYLKTYVGLRLSPAHSQLSLDSDGSNEPKTDGGPESQPADTQRTDGGSDTSTVEPIPQSIKSGLRRSAKKGSATSRQTPASEQNDDLDKLNEIDEQQEFRKRKGDDKPVLADDFFYDYNELIAKPVISEQSELPQDLLTLYHSFGYDCKKRSNLHIIDPECLLFSAGNVVEILNMRSKQQTHLPTTSGASVGCLTVHPTSQYFAVGEKGNMPNINIFEYPSLKLYRILRQGALKGYAHLDFNTNGDLLASLGTGPDYMLTIWDWRQENVVLRTKAFSQDVYKVTFSKDLKGILTTAGSGHIRFWKMANTFTGYKLQGQLGKFGKTEISDIEGYVELPDGKVLSGCEWGGMLLWDGGLIQTEICRKKNKPCHSGSINQIILDEGDIFTIGEDGSVRVWDFETIDTAEPSDDGGKLEIEPLNELLVGKNVALKSMVKDCVDESTYWYAQDSNGGIWKLDLSFSASSEDPKQLFSFHAGCINGIDTCPNSHLVATTADDGTVKVYNYVTRETIVQKKFNRPGTSLKWLPLASDEEGATIVVGFGDGALRFFKLIQKANLTFDLVMFEVFKPHTKPITYIEIDARCGLIATGSDDNTIFFFETAKNKRKPVGFVNVPSTITFMSWTPPEYRQNRLLVCMKDGKVHEYDAPIPESYDITKTYLIDAKLHHRAFQFTSVKSKLRHEEELERKRIEEEERKKKEAEERRLRGDDEEDDKKKKKPVKKEETKIDFDEEIEGEEGEKKKEAPETPEPEKPKEEEWKPYIPEIPNKIFWAHYSSPDTFWLSVDDYDAGYLYECRFVSNAERARSAVIDKIDEPVQAVPVPKSDLLFSEDIPLSCLTFNKQKTHSFIGQKNGVIRYQPVPQSKSIKDLQHYWSRGYHDTDYGCIKRICLSFDERFVFSVGNDSNIFACVFNCSVDVVEQARMEPINIPVRTNLNEEQDIDDPSAYSIEQSKQKSEHDKMMMSAEAKKQDMRQKINELRAKFKELLIKNEQLPNRIQMSTGKRSDLGDIKFEINIFFQKDFIFDETIKDQVLKQLDEKISQTHRELEWYTEKSRIALDKVKSRFRDTIEFDHLRLFTFDMDCEVATFRTLQLPRDIDNFETELTRQYTLNLIEKQKSRDIDDSAYTVIMTDNNNLRLIPNSQSKASQLATYIDNPSGLSLMDEGAVAQELANISAGQLLNQNQNDQIKKMFSKLRGNTAVRVERALRKMEEKKLKRLKRKKEWEELLGARLPENYENPEDLASIKDAEDNLGDFKLKSSEDYILPEEQRMNVFKATKRLILIKQTMHKIQTSFNTRVVELRDKKLNLIDQLNKDIDRLEQIKFILSQNDFRLPERPKIKPEEIPEKMFESSKEKLAEFQKEVEARPGLLEGYLFDDGSAAQAANNNGFNNGDRAAPKKQEPSVIIDPAQLSFLQRVENLKPLWHNKELMSPIMLKKAKLEEIKLLHEQQAILKSFEEKVAIFDAELKLLRHEKAKIAILLKHVDLRHVTLYEEFMLLRDFEKTENELEEKLVKRKEEHLEAQGKLTEIQQKIDGKRKDIDKLEDKQKQLLDTFHQMTADETKFTDFLTKLYKKKIKRKKNVEGEDDEDESDEESDESDSEDEDELEDDDDSDAEGRERLDLDMCPSGLSQELYDQVCQLREKRLDLEDLQAEEKKILEQFKKDQESGVKKAKLVENTLKQAQQDLENFQKEKQKKINNLDIVVTMNFNQLQYLDKGYLPADLSEALVFDSKNLDRLQERIKELQAEKVNEKKSFKLLKERHLGLIRDKKKMEEYLAKLEEACEKMMVDKFGKTVDIEKLELVMVNQQIEELKQRLAENEFEHEKVMKDWLRQINDEKDESTDLLKANTSRINELVDLLQETKKLEKTLNSKQKNLGEEFSGVTKKEVDERERLQTLVQLQSQEIEALKAEISILSRKGGHILPPSQPPTNNTRVQPV